MTKAPSVHYRLFLHCFVFLPCIYCSRGLLGVFAGTLVRHQPNFRLASGHWEAEKSYFSRRFKGNVHRRWFYY